MKIEHIGTYVNVFEATEEFFEKYFSVKAGPKYHNKKTGFTSYFLSFVDGYYKSLFLNFDNLLIELTIKSN